MPSRSLDPLLLAPLAGALCIASCAHRAEPPAAGAAPAPASGGADAGPARVEWVEYGGSNGIRRAPRDAQRCSVDEPCRPSPELPSPQCLPPLPPRAAVLCGVDCPGLRPSPCSEEAGCPPGSKCRRRGAGEAVSAAPGPEGGGDEACVPPRCGADADCAGGPRFGCAGGQCAVRACRRDADCAPGGACIPPEQRCMRDATGACWPIRTSPLPEPTCYPERGRCGEHSIEAVP